MADVVNEVVEAPHVVLIDRHEFLHSRTLSPAALERLENAFRSAPAMSDPYLRAGFTRVVRASLEHEARNGLILIEADEEPALPVPYPYGFEPTPIGGSTKSFHERGLIARSPARRTTIWWTTLLVLMAATAIYRSLEICDSGGSVLRWSGFVVSVGIVAFFAMVAFGYDPSGRWYLVPGGILIAPRMFGAAGRRLYTRATACLVLRLREKKKTPFFTIEMISVDGRQASRIVSDEESQAILSAWMSPVEPPTMDQLAQFR